jgi:hypothetical protein
MVYASITLTCLSILTLFATSPKIYVCTLRYNTSGKGWRKIPSQNFYSNNAASFLWKWLPTLQERPTITT